MPSLRAPRPRPSACASSTQAAARLRATSACRASSSRSVRPRSSSRAWRAHERLQSASGRGRAAGCCETSSALTRPRELEVLLQAASGTNTARTSPCCGWSENSPSCARREHGRATSSRSVRPSVLLPAVQRLERNRGRPLQSGRAPWRRLRRAELARERRAEQRVAARRSGCASDAVELPEPIVHAVDLHARAPAARSPDRSPARARRSAGRVAGTSPANAGSAADVVGERFAEEVRRTTTAESVRPSRCEHEVAQAAAHRVADEQRAGQHRTAVATPATTARFVRQ